MIKAKENDVKQVRGIFYQFLENEWVEIDIFDLIEPFGLREQKIILHEYERLIKQFG